MDYLSSEITKQPTTFKIGIFTVFIVVMFITMLQSVVDCAPILFVKIGQDEAGSFDIKVTRKSPNLQVSTGNMNYYALDPNYGPFEWRKPVDKDQVPDEHNCGYIDPMEDPDDDPEANDLPDIKQPYVCPDYIADHDKSASLMRLNYYQNALADFGDKFDGWVPRSYVPSADLAAESDPDTTVT